MLGPLCQNIGGGAGGGMIKKLVTQVVILATGMDFTHQWQPAAVDTVAPGTILQQQLVPVVTVVDIDECAPGGEASSCNETTGGVCIGHLPDRKFLCTCKPGYNLINDTVCEGVYE